MKTRCLVIALTLASLSTIGCATRSAVAGAGAARSR